VANQKHFKAQKKIEIYREHIENNFLQKEKTFYQDYN